MSIGIGIVGVGMISNFHAKAIADSANGRLVGCYNRSSERAQQFAAAHNCQVYGSLEDMLADPEISAVAICTPSGAHLEPALAAAQAGKHVIVEKPLEVTPEKCDQIIDACAQANVKLAVTFQSRFHRSSQLMKAAVDEGRFGKITMGDTYVKWFRSQEYYDSGAWRGTWALDGGGALMNQAIHSVDLLLWLMGPVQRVSAMMGTMTHERIEVEDIVVANVQFENGALGVIEATTTAFPGALKRVEIAGNKGSAVLEEEDIKQWQFADETADDAAIRESMSGQTQTGGGAADPAAIGHHGHTEVFNDFLEAIEHDREPLINGPEGRRSVEVICAIYESARSGQTVTL
ncbi:Gfo/Idh/MocA family protein [Allorhodopirellula heiligendammensis]|uniref:Glucose--fructose oxidoreductase n=1 Tax=Allorhodopirellula heiligendammensis TaxID=2714739 RepID=A0A5C6BGW2_9BACT|nr:Gfo/Idh/MocA family oxidoreductase [Allorhodopirellula heiligendammensis]TWU10887.1 Glucose--fructose oxidoreductase precursor [Allorhodopirellula heiligendammensis]